MLDQSKWETIAPYKKEEIIIVEIPSLSILSNQKAKIKHQTLPASGKNMTKRRVLIADGRRKKMIKGGKKR